MKKLKDLIKAKDYAAVKAMIIEHRDELDVVADTLLSVIDEYEKKLPSFQWKPARDPRTGWDTKTLENVKIECEIKTPSESFRLPALTIEDFNAKYEKEIPLTLGTTDVIGGYDNGELIWFNYDADTMSLVPAKGGKLDEIANMPVPDRDFTETDREIVIEAVLDKIRKLGW